MLTTMSIKVHSLPSNINISQYVTNPMLKDKLDVTTTTTCKTFLKRCLLKKVQEQVSLLSDHYFY